MQNIFNIFSIIRNAKWKQNFNVMTHVSLCYKHFAQFPFHTLAESSLNAWVMFAAHRSLQMEILKRLIRIIISASRARSLPMNEHIMLLVKHPANFTMAEHLILTLDNNKFKPPPHLTPSRPSAKTHRFN